MRSSPGEISEKLRAAYDVSSLAIILGCSPQQFGYYVYKRSIPAQYISFEIAKRRGGYRTINAPNTNLKIIQRNISEVLQQLRVFKRCVKGFVPGRDIKQNAALHVGQKFVLNIDLENFFGTINYGRVYGLLLKPPYSFAKPVAAAIAKATTLNNELPQGAPSSPVITNLICAKMDAELARFAHANQCVYSRYADDMTFSTNRAVMPLAVNRADASGVVRCEIIRSLRNIIQSNGFKINELKLRLSERTNRQEVTGLIVNRKLNVKRRYVREIRAMLHAWEKFGLGEAQRERQEKYHGGEADFESVVRGKIIFLGQIRERSDEIFRKFAERFNRLTSGSKIRMSLTPREIAEQAVWVIEHDNQQGTAFFLAGYGLVTCAHCVFDEEDIGANLHIYHPKNHTVRIPVTLKAADRGRDLAVLNVPAGICVVPMPHYSGTVASPGADIALMGYPNHHAARSIRVESDKLIRRFIRGGVNYIEIGSRVIEGNSGRPVLNAMNEVVGIAAKGISANSNSNPEFLAIDASELKELKILIT